MIWFPVLWGSLPLGVYRVLWVGVSWPTRVRWVPSGPVPLPSCRFPVLGDAAVSLSSSGACAVACVVALAVAGVVAWRLGCAVGLRGVLGGSLGGCSPFSLCRCTLLPLRGVQWPVRATRCGLCGVRSLSRRHVLAGVRL